MGGDPNRFSRRKRDGGRRAGGSGVGAQHHPDRPVTARTWTGALGANSARRLLTAAAGVPPGARAALVNLTIVADSPSGFLALFRGDQTWPGNSTINWDHPQQIIANTTTVPLDALGGFCARAKASTHFLIDVIGYYP